MSINVKHLQTDKAEKPSLSSVAPHPNPRQKATTSNLAGCAVCLVFPAVSYGKTQTELIGQPNMMTEIQHPWRHPLAESWLPLLWEPGELGRKLRLLLLNYREPEVWAGQRLPRIRQNLTESDPD